MAWTQSDVDALKAAIASGVRVVEYHDRKVEYQTTHEMLEALGPMQQEVNATNHTAKPFIRVGTSKGLDKSCN
jgi:hypothetical protein